MKVVQWYPKDVPADIEFTEEGEWCFEDWYTNWDLEEGDLVQMVSNSNDWGTRCYQVVSTIPIDETEEGYCTRYLVLIEE